MQENTICFATCHRMVTIYFKGFYCKGESDEKNIDQYLGRGNGSLGGSVRRTSFELRSRGNTPSRHRSKS